MPLNLPPGTDQSVSPAVTPTWVFTPPANVNATLRVYNTGTNPVYVGGAGVTIYNGLVVPPGSRPVEMQNVQQSVYAVSGITGGLAGAGTMSATGVTAGTTAVTLAAAVGASLAANTAFVLGLTATTSGCEVLVVSSTTSSSVVNFKTGCLLDHAGSSVLYPTTILPGQIRVTAGVV